MDSDSTIGIPVLEPVELEMFIRHRQKSFLRTSVSPIPWGLKRYYGTGSLHFITWSCYQREPLLHTEARRDLLLAVLEKMRARYRFAVIGYVVMPEHVHLLVSEPQIANPSTVVQAVKLGFTRQVLDGIHSDSARHIWQSRFYDFNLWSQRKEIEKLKYMHRNPVVRGLVEKPDPWRWSSYPSYAYGEPGMVRVNDWSWWEEKVPARAG